MSSYYLKTVDKKKLSKAIGKEVYWTEVLPFRSDYLRVHFDRERYLSDCFDYSLAEVKKLMK